MENIKEFGNTQSKFNELLIWYKNQLNILKEITDELIIIDNKILKDLKGETKISLRKNNVEETELGYIQKFENLNIEFDENNKILNDLILKFKNIF